MPADMGGADDREAIRDCLYRYSRGVDRCDEDMLRSVYWEDAIDDHCLFTGQREELIAWVMPLLRSMDPSLEEAAAVSGASPARTAPSSSDSSAADVSA